ncbi:unnamed protein product [Heligmosomoides polygyrus]|uniref:G_PROTEIN_RECEP_F1_2 domain-containing protein n=1 Tax=Heligmosomoides polygyrus TaxID=6339 RepID=A0A183G0F7_HELPZ|nr:unnamed protein product [Heligmosomoides polygyrus]
MTLKFWLGMLLGFITFAGLISTIVVLLAVLKLAVYKRKSPIYLISAANMLCDTVQLLLAMFYLVPSIIFDVGNWLLEGGRQNQVVQLLGAVFLFCWYYGTVAQMLMAINRLVVVCLPNISIFSYRNVSVFVLALLPIAVVVTYVSQFVSPCCQFSFDHEVLSYSYTDNGSIPNYSNMYIDLPLNSSSSLICAVCYAYIIVFVWRMNYLYNVDTTGSHSRIKEYRYALQFCAISVFYLTAWVTFRVFPILIGAKGVEYFIVISMCVSVNASANAIVYITSNQEVRLSLGISF